ncbi:MAG: hypothetical protein L6Q55_04220 [Azonexus sp.]|nr:hypothetical protein [Azonexus sp.]MCK6411614.1 hypothetical protein [Azonexus sp.]
MEKYVFLTFTVGNRDLPTIAITTPPGAGSATLGQVYPAPKMSNPPLEMHQEGAIMRADLKQCSPMDFSKTTLHHILDSLTSAECSKAILAQQIGNLATLSKKPQLDPETTASLHSCRTLLQIPLEKLLLEQGRVPQDIAPEK